MQETVKLLGTAATAARLRTTPSNLTRWVRSGKITPAAKGSGRTGEFLFAPEEIERCARDSGILLAEGV